MIHAVDFFCGAGGFTCGMKQAGINVIAGIDNSPDVRYAYEYNNDVMLMCCDTSRVELGDLPRPLLFVGCAPCQAFSQLTAWQKNIKQDPRRKLPNAFLQQVLKHMPEFVLCENVPPAKNSSEYKEFAEALRKAGYTVTIDVVNAYDYGVPQKRRRLVLAASLWNPVNIHNYADKRYTVRDAIGHLPPLESGQQCSSDDHHVCRKHSDIVVERLKYIPPGQGITCVPDYLRVGMSTTFRYKYRRLVWDEPAFTITGNFMNPGGGPFVHPEQNRTLSLREGACIQGFPDYYRFADAISIDATQRMIGNAVPPPMARKLAEAVLKCI